MQTVKVQMSLVGWIMTTGAVIMITSMMLTMMTVKTAVMATMIMTTMRGQDAEDDDGDDDGDDACDGRDGSCSDYDDVDLPAGCRHHCKGLTHVYATDIVCTAYDLFRHDCLQKMKQDLVKDTGRFDESRFREIVKKVHKLWILYTQNSAIFRKV